MYTLSNRFKIFSLSLIILGSLGWFYSYSKSHLTIEEVKILLAEESHYGSHSDQTHSMDHQNEIHHNEGVYENENHEVNHEAHGHKAHGHEDEHAEHVLHQIHNRPYAALYVAAFFFMMISLGVLAFYAIQYASQAGWSPVLFRVMEAITYYLLPGAIIVLLIAIIGDKHSFIWMDPEVVAHDKIIQGKESWLNKNAFIVRGLIYIGGWSLYRYFSRKFSLAQDKANDNKNFKRNFQISAGFLVFFIYTESMMSWDWIMSVDPHWFSTLFGWYVLASMVVSGITVIALITIYLNSKGLMKYVNDSQLHELD